MPTYNTLLFDCDNTLVLSEHLAFEACADMFNQICSDHNLPDRFTGSTLIKKFVGQNFRGMLSTLQAENNFTIPPDELEGYVAQEEVAVIAKLRSGLKPCEGVDAELERLSREGKYKLAVVSSSAIRRVIASVEIVGQDKYFPKDFIYSAASSLPKPTSKPDPAVYLWALDKLGSKAEESIAIEDSRSGTLSGTRAGIKVVGYVGPYEAEEQEKMVETLTEAGAVVIMRHWSEFPAILEKFQNGTI
ncbi:to HAD superfamily hydrolase [Geosmithia morbida]|uniref:To HAD superfamily hydrolase n=1 Tax=Geosmithia morbida TaxID=1094350 RepID=A0A9P4YS59_9HYPO|nr:to HAD superfamily hydrolase [Geosmithia morbida]KAF4120847.1 to HAD superfamily hydrolase [Geosmithia morbida]